MNNPENLNWKNPCPDASVPAHPSGTFGELMMYPNGSTFAPQGSGGNVPLPVPENFGVGGIGSGINLAGCAAPSPTFIIHTTPSWDAKPTVAAKPTIESIEPLIEQIRQTFKENQRLLELVNHYTSLYEEAQSKLSKIKQQL